MPNSLYYHFTCANYGIENLENSRLKVARFQTLNDPFEMMPYRRYKTLNERKPYTDFFQKMDKKYGLLCFSSTYHDQLLWAHYADGHTGIALGFEITNNDLLEVNYTSENIRPKLSLSADTSENEINYLKLAKTKYAEWQYEKEHRLIVELKECTKADDLFFMPFSSSLALKQVILGARFNHKDNQERILSLKNNLGFEIIASRIGWEDYKVRKDGTRTKWYSN